MDTTRSLMYFYHTIFLDPHAEELQVPEVKGLVAYMSKYPGKVVHSKTYRSPVVYTSKKVLIIGNSASGHDITTDLLSTAQLPVIQSRRSHSRWDGSTPPAGIVWKPVISEFHDDGSISFSDGSVLNAPEVDTVIYATGYLPSYPFWNSKKNGRDLWDYEKGKLTKSYLHTFSPDYPTLAIVGVPRTLTFRSFEYQAIALARLFSKRSAKGLPSVTDQERWEKKREKEERKKFHDIPWEDGETLEWLGMLYEIAGLAQLTGEGRNPPVLGKDLRWAIEHKRKYPEPGMEEGDMNSKDKKTDNEWVLVERGEKKDLLHFI